MEWIGRVLTVAGILCIILPIIGGLAYLAGTELPYVVSYAPTFVLGGILLFVIGIALRTLAS